MTSAGNTDAASLRMGRNGNQFGKLHMWITLHPAVEAPAAAIHGLLCALAREDGETAMPSMAQIGKAFNIKSRTTVRKYLNQLRDADGLDYYQRRTADNWKTRNVYTIHFDPPNSFDGFTTWRRWKEHHFPRPANESGSDPAPGSDGQKLAMDGQQAPHQGQESAHLSRALDVETSPTPGGCVDDASAASAAAPPDRTADIARVVCGIYSAEQRARITAADHVAAINARLGAHLANGWTVEGLLAQLERRVRVNSRTVAFGQLLIDALAALDALAPNEAGADPWSAGDPGGDVRKEPLKPRRSRSKKIEPVSVGHPGFVAFWKAYGHKSSSKLKARESYAKALHHVDDGTLVAAAAAYREFLDATDTPQCHAATWLNQHRWEVDYTGALADELARRAPVRESLSARRNREIDDAVAAVAAELAGEPPPDAPSAAWRGTVIDAEGRPA